MRVDPARPSGTRVASSGLASIGYNPSWAPDGSEIVCGTEDVDLPFTRLGKSLLWKINVNSGQKQQISKEDVVQPAWSPHGYQIAYWGIPWDQGGGQRDIWTITANGKDPVAVTGDKAMLALGNYNGIAILSLREYLLTE